MRDAPEFDIVLWGATGFTGRLVAEHLLRAHGAAGEVRWAMGGRSLQKLQTVREGLGPAAADVPLVVGDNHDRASLDAMVARTRVVCSTVGPFALYGSELVGACAAAGTDYCDITGEVQWIRAMLDQHEATAQASGARIIHCCGFDSLPSDLGTLYLTDAMTERGLQPARVAFYLAGGNGAFSGGTAASLLHIVKQARTDKALRRLLLDPYALNPRDGPRGPDGRDQRSPEFDATMNAWTAPFLMAPINTRIVRRTQALQGFPFGEDFRYSETMLTGRGLKGRAVATGISAALGGFIGAASAAPGLVSRLVPAPGEGPDEATRKAGFWKVKLRGESRSGDALMCAVSGEGDPGYGSTARMLGESAVCLATACERPGGFWTPASALGRPLIEQLQARAGVTFAVTTG